MSVNLYKVMNCVSLKQGFSTCVLWYFLSLQVFRRNSYIALYAVLYALKLFKVVLKHKKVKKKVENHCHTLINLFHKLETD